MGIFFIPFDKGKGIFLSFVDQSVLGELQQELRVRIPQVLFEQWFGQAEILSWDGSVLELGVQNRFFKSRIETTYLGVLHEAASAVFGRPIHIQISVSKRLLAAFRQSQKEAEADAATLVLETKIAPPVLVEESKVSLGVELNRDFTFDTFVVGSSNRLSHAVALRAVDAPGQFTRIYFCGSHGMGKTHLMQAVCHAYRGGHPEARVAYVTAERFVADFTSAHANGTLKDFRAFYRGLSMLAFDEVQALGVGNKAGTQAELLSILDELDARRRQVVLAGTHAPGELEGVDPKLRDRLCAGFVDKLSMPDESTRGELVVRKMAERGIDLPSSAVGLLARELSGNVRQLEGTVNRLAALIELEGMEPTTTCIRMALEVSRPAVRKSALTYQDIIKAVGGEFDVTPEAIIGRGRSLPVRRARQVAVVLCRRVVGGRFAEIGEVFGKRTHATIISIARMVDPDLFGSGLSGRPVERILFRLGLEIKPEELLDRQKALFE
jgi:ATPase involved in DNA replication initiation